MDLEILLLSASYLQKNGTKISHEGCSSCGPSLSQDLLVVVDVDLDLGDDVQGPTLSRKLAAFRVHGDDVLKQGDVPQVVVQLVHSVVAVALLQRSKRRCVITITAASSGELA